MSGWVRDGMFIIGLALMGTGLALLWGVPLMLVIVGAVLMVLALIGAWRANGTSRGKS